MTLDESWKDKANIRLVGRAIRQGWPIPDNVREAVMNRMARLVLDPKSGDRTAVAAARVLVSADSINARREGVAAIQEFGMPIPATIVLSEAAYRQRALEALGLIESENENEIEK